MQERIPPLIEQQICFAHRGARAHVRENTIDAFELAIRLGATGIESDTWITRDGSVVLDHDGVVKGRLRSKAIRQCDYSELPKWIPTLNEMYERVGNSQHISLDIKDLGSMESVVKIVESKGDPEKTWLCHPDLDFLETWRKRQLSVNLVHSTRLKSLQKGPERHAARLRELGISTINMPFTDWNGGLVALFHRFNIYCFGWNLQFPDVIYTGLRMGLDGIFTDWPDRASDAVKKLHG